MSIKSKIENFKAWWNHMNELKKEPVAIAEPMHEHHICSHCGYGYDGRCCPQCGMPAGNERFTFKRLIRNFLDIWGFGSRPMFRTIRDLFWRPGYMIRDYLSGHYLSYFPPFKMLAVLTAIIVVLALLFHTKDNDFGGILIEAIDAVTRNVKDKPVAEGIKRVIRYFSDNDLYRIFAQNIVMIIVVWMLFRKKGYNLVETAFSQIYINCQFHIITILFLLITFKLPETSILPYSVPSMVAFIMLVYDFKQLYDLTIKKAIWKTFVLIFLVILFYFILLFLVLFIISLFNEIDVKTLKNI